MSKEKADEMALWRTWKDGGQRPEDLEPLLQSLNPLVQRRVSTFAGRVPIPRSVLEAEAQKLVIVALEKYDPEKAQLSTQVTNHLKGLQRTVIKGQNVSRITEDRARRIGDYRRAEATLLAENGEQPTPQQIAARMGISTKKAILLKGEMRRDLIASASPVEDPFLDETPAHVEVLKLLHLDFAPTSDEYKLLEYLQGLNGKPKVTKTNLVAQKLGWTPSKVSQTRNRIIQVARQYL